LLLNGKIYKAIKEQKQFNTLRNPKPTASGSSYFYHFIKILRSFRLQKNYMPSLRDVLYKDTFKGGLHTLLRYADRNSMAHSREVRLPFLDHRLVEFVFSLPDEMILKDGWTKLILRESMDQILPSEITWRVDKIGYETPQSDWIDKILSRRDIQLADEYLTDNHLEKLSSKLSIWDKLMVSKFGVKSTAMNHSI
jgi:asparagine synthetase B (glutamine-hydrolysing)